MLRHRQQRERGIAPGDEDEDHRVIQAFIQVRALRLPVHLVGAANGEIYDRRVDQRRFRPGGVHRQDTETSAALAMTATIAA